MDLQPCSSHWRAAPGYLERNTVKFGCGSMNTYKYWCGCLLLWSTLGGPNKIYKGKNYSRCWQRSEDVKINEFVFCFLSKTTYIYKKCFSVENYPIIFFLYVKNLVNIFSQLKGTFWRKNQSSENYLQKILKIVWCEIFFGLIFIFVFSKMISTTSTNFA